VTPIHPATYTTLMTIIAADVRTPIVAAPIAMMIAGAAVRVSAVMSTAIYTSIMSAVDASNASGC
jgi:hypothetical protein